MKTISDAKLIGRLDADQRGVLSKADLQTALGAAHPTALVRRVQRLESAGILRRFCRGWYVTQDFDLPTLSQCIAPDSYISFGIVLARELMIGTDATRQVTAVKHGRTRQYAALGCRIEHVRIAPHLCFGFSAVGGVRFADREKAVLDVLYFHLRGRRYPFDLFSDIDFSRLDRARLADYLTRYRNPKFVAFVAGVLDR
jgi:hypothetical protein